MNKLVN